MHYKKDRVALKPPLGWNSWDCYGPPSMKYSFWAMRVIWQST